jgi:cytochrome c-type biogenesis protein
MFGIEVSYLAAAIAGLVSFLSPCVLPLVPAYISYVAGTSLEELTADGGIDPNLTARVVTSAIIFVLGFTVVFVMLGASASAVGSLILEHRVIIGRIAGAVIVIFGLHYMGVFRRVGLLNFLQRDVRFHGKTKQRGALGAFLIGIAFGFGWTPCIGPILATILTIAASGDSLGFGVSLLAVYSLGLGIPFIAAAFAVRPFMGFMKRFRQHLHKVEICAGAVLVGTGGLMFFDQFSRLGFYLLEVFPVLGLIG